jgi:hypothetical protein
MSRRRMPRLAGAVLLAALLALSAVYAGSTLAGTKGVGQQSEVFSLAVGSGSGQVGYVAGNDDAEAWGPWSFTVMNNGRVAILDAANRRLLVVDRSGHEVQSIAYGDLGLVSPMDVYEWRGRLAVADCSTTPEAVVLVDLGSGRSDGRIELPDGLAEAGPLFMGSGDGGLQLVLGGTESHSVAAGAKVREVASIRESEQAVDVPGVGKTTVETGVAADKKGPRVSVARVGDNARVVRDVGADGVAAQRVRPLGSTRAGNLLADTAYIVPAGDGVQVKFYVEELSRDNLGTLASVTVPTDEFYIWPQRYLAVDRKGQIWCMVAGKERVSFRILEPCPDRPDVDDGSIARSVNAFAKSVGRGLLDAIQPPVAYADVSPPARANPWTRDNGQSVAFSYGYTTWTCSSGAYSRSCNLADNIRPRFLYSGGTFTGVAYAWGKYTTPASFKSYVEAGTYDAGDIGTTTVETCTVGTDCSGLVTRIWGLTSKHSTTTLPAHATRLADSTPLGQLSRGDVFDRTLSPGRHVLCFNAFQNTDSFYACEATTRNSVDRVVYWTRSKAELLANSYHMYRYNYWTN